MQKIPDYSGEYRNQAIIVLFSIFVFILIYLLILLLSIALAAGLIVSALILFQPLTFYISIIIGTAGIVLLIFIVKFFFRRSTIDRSMWVEITKNEQPKLFELIESIAADVDTNPPQRVYLSPGLDASVFYDSNFWNLFFPSKENLVIGLGLINSTNESELKAILVHEFGHFTQRSLKIFSYVYIENQIIYKMLIDEGYYFSLISRFNKGVFVWIVIGYSNFIKWILRKAYEIVHLNYLSLSRELEYHADEISAYLAGTIPNVNSLLRYDISISTFDYLGEFYFNLVSENLKTDNIYPQHYFAMITSAKNNGAEIKDGLPLITKEIVNRFNRSKLVIKDQWASHPSIPDRIKRLEEMNIDVTVSSKLAWELIDNREALERNLTNKLFQRFQYSEETTNMDLKEFKERYSKETETFKFDKRYNSFYNTKDISVFDVEKVTETSDGSNLKDIAEIYSPENVEMILEGSGLLNDIKLLESIDRKEIRTDSFEYDSKKYHANESKKLLNKLTEMHKTLFERIAKLDIDIYKFFLGKAKELGLENIFTKKYKSYFKLVKEDKDNLQLYLDMISSLQFIAQFRSFGNIEQNIKELQKKEEKFKEKLEQLLSNEFYKPLIDKEKKEKIEKYISKDWIYFKEKKYDEEAIAVLEESIYLYYSICSKAPFSALKDLLDYQISLLDN